MKKALILLVLLTAVAAAQQAAPPPVQATNLVEKPLAPSYSDLYCAGFVTAQPISPANFVAGGADTPNEFMYADRDTLFLKGSGYQVNALFTIIRQVTDPNRFSVFEGQSALLARMGKPYAELARVRVLKVLGDAAVAHIEFSCQPVTPGDLVVPFQERPQVSFRTDRVQFDEFPAPAPAAGRIVLARDFDTFLGTGAKVYINVGAQKGVRVGDYLRVTHSYRPENMDPADATAYRAAQGLEGQKDVPSVASQAGSLPREAVGEIIILNVTPTSATGMVTLALKTIRVGDVVEFETAKE